MSPSPYQYRKQKQELQKNSANVGIEVRSSQSISGYIKIVSVSSKSTAREYLFRLQQFEEYCRTVHNFNLDDLLISKTFRIDPYELIRGFVSYLIDKKSCTNQTIKQRAITARDLLE